MVGRINGLNFAAIYDNSKALGYRNVDLSKGQTWKQYVNFLLQTLPKDTREIYLRKFYSSKKYWLEKSGVLPIAIVDELNKIGISFIYLGKPKNDRAYKSEYRWIKFKNYPDELSIKQYIKGMCITILKNDTSCHYMVFL